MRKIKRSAHFYLAFLAGIWALGGLPASAHAMACAVFSEHGAQIRLPGTARPVRTPYQSANCNNITVIRGQAEVCFVRSGGQPACTAAPKGPLNAQALGASPTGNADFMAGLVRLLKENSRAASAKVQLSARAIPIEVPGFPYRNVLPQAGPLVIPLAGISPARLDDFRLYDMSINMNRDIRRVYDSGPVTGNVIIPANRLKPGIDYEWKANQDGRRLSGAFHAASFREAVQMRERLDRIESDPTLTAYEKNLLKANAYTEAGFTLNGQQQLLAGQAAAGVPQPSENWGREFALSCP